MDRERLGTAGWVGLGVYVAAWDKLAPETLTHAYKRYPTALRIGALAITGAHLMGAIPRKYDPFYWAVDHGPFGNDVDKGPTIDDSME